MIEGEGTVFIRRPAREILEFVLDLERYRQADRKFRRIQFVARSGNEGLARYSGRLRGLPTPADTQAWTLEPYTRLDFRSTRKLWPNVVATFHGWFVCRETPKGTRVTHVERLFFRPPLKWVAEPFLRKWWAQQIADEVMRLGELLERDEFPLPRR